MLSLYILCKSIKQTKRQYLLIPFSAYKIVTWTVRNEMPQKGIYAGEPTEAMVDITVISVVEYYMAFKMIGDTTVCMSS